LPNLRVYGHIRRLDHTTTYHVKGYTRKSGTQVKGYDVTRKIYEHRAIDKNFEEHTNREDIKEFFDNLEYEGWEWIDRKDEYTE